MPRYVGRGYWLSREQTLVKSLPALHSKAVAQITGNIVKVWHEHFTYDCTAKYAHVALANFLNLLFFEVLECMEFRAVSLQPTILMLKRHNKETQLSSSFIMLVFDVGHLLLLILLSLLRDLRNRSSITFPSVRSITEITYITIQLTALGKPTKTKCGK